MARNNHQGDTVRKGKLFCIRILDLSLMPRSVVDVGFQGFWELVLHRCPG